MQLRLAERRAAIRDALIANTHHRDRKTRAFFFLLRLGIRIVKQWIDDKPLQKSAALTFRTALALVPMLAIALTLMRAFGDHKVEDGLFDFISTQLLPDMPDVTRQLQSFSQKISENALGVIGLTFTFATSWGLYNAVERGFNDIWRASAHRTLLSRLLTFYALVTLLPALAGASLYWTGRIIGESASSAISIPLLIQFVSLFLTNKLLPNTSVRWSAALAGTLVTGILLEILKWGFVAFAKRMLLDSYHGVYGSVGIVPMLLIWINLSWMMVLLGAEIASALQNLKSLEAEDRRTTGEEPVNGLSAAQILSVVAADHEKGGSGVSRAKLSETFGLTQQAIEAICERLKSRGLIAEVQGDKEGYIPGRDPRMIKLEEVLHAFRATDLETAAGITSPALRQIVTDIESARNTRIEGVTVADLEPRDRVSGPRKRADLPGEAKD